MDIVEALALILIGALTGAAGQGVRAIIGIKKRLEETSHGKNETEKDWFDGKKLVFSFIVGSIAGILAAAYQLEPGILITKELVLGFAVAGYAGTDFIQGVLHWLPDKKLKKGEGISA